LFHLKEISLPQRYEKVINKLSTSTINENVWRCILGILLVAFCKTAVTKEIRRRRYKTE